jgi:hypothetical protein
MCAFTWKCGRSILSIFPLTSLSFSSLLCLTCTDFPIDEICALLRFYAVYNGTYRRFGTTCRSYLKVSRSSWKFWTSENETRYIVSKRGQETTGLRCVNSPKYRRSHSFSGGSLKLRTVYNRNLFRRMSVLKYIQEVIPVFQVSTWRGKPRSPCLNGE